MSTFFIILEINGRNHTHHNPPRHNHYGPINHLFHILFIIFLNDYQNSWHCRRIIASTCLGMLTLIYEYRKTLLAKCTCSSLNSTCTNFLYTYFLYIFEEVQLVLDKNCTSDRTAIVLAECVI